jgi:hypothetical protein
MNIFEDLIEELKEENLLEETVIETNLAEEKRKQAASEAADEAAFAAETTEISGMDDEFPEEFEFEHSSPEAEAGDDEQIPEDGQIPELEDETAEAAQADEAGTPDDEAETLEDSPAAEESKDSELVEQNQESANGVEFYRQRAMKEVSGLQMVEHVLSGVEREQMKVVPKPYDDLEAKKILHHFLQVTKDLNSPEHAQAEFQLMQETESWYSALSRRDKNVSVTHLRRYCETTRPILSSQALISVARFYRNSPFSEQVRSKFDLVITRLFAKEIGGEKRQMVFEREEMIKHLTMLYGEWASIPMYAAAEDDSEVVLLALKFEDFMTEADEAGSFDELIKNDFFNRLRLFKESTHENFFAPLITATAIECNVRIGNRYVDLIQLEKEKVESEKLQDKYGFLHDQSISEAASKTLQLVDLLKQKSVNVDGDSQEDAESESVEQAKTTPSASTEKTEKIEEKKVRSKYAVNKWLLLATILVVVVNIGLYVWMSYNTEPENVTQNVKRVNLENSSLKDFIREARISNDTFFAVVQPNWSGLAHDKQEELLKKVFATGVEKGFNKVHLLDSQGKTVGFADAENVTVY